MMHYSIYDRAIKKGFSEKEAEALYFLDGIPINKQEDLLEQLIIAIGRYKINKRDWKIFKGSDEYKKSKRDLKKYDDEYHAKIEAAKRFLLKLNIKNIEDVFTTIDDDKKMEYHFEFEFNRAGDFSLSMRQNIRKELPYEIVFQILQWKIERKNWRSQRLKIYPQQPNKKQTEEILSTIYDKYFTDPVSTKITDFLKTFN